MRLRTEHQILSSRNFERSSSTRSFVVISVSNARSQATLSLRSDSDGITMIATAKAPRIHKPIQASHDRPNGESTVKTLAVMLSPFVIQRADFQNSEHAPQRQKISHRFEGAKPQVEAWGIKSAGTGRGANLHNRGAVTVMTDGRSFLAFAGISRFALGSSAFVHAKVLFTASSRQSAGLATCIRTPPASHLSCGRPPTPPNRCRPARKFMIPGQAQALTDGQSAMRSHSLHLIKGNQLLRLVHTLFRMK